VLEFVLSCTVSEGELGEGGLVESDDFCDILEMDQLLIRRVLLKAGG
jgi:hypothetical protein